MSHKYAFTGPYADVNFGDYAMFINDLYDIEAISGTVFTYNRPFTEAICTHYFPGNHFTHFEVQVRTEIEKDLTFNFHQLQASAEKLFPSFSEILDEMQYCEILIVTGGGYFNGLWWLPHRRPRLLQIIAPILAAKILGKEIIFLANGFGPFDGGEDFFSSFFQIFQNITFPCRDKTLSPRALRQLGVSNNYISHAPDDLLFMNSQLYERSPTFRTKFSEYVVMETYLPIDEIRSNLPQIKSFAESLFTKHGLGLVLLPFNVGAGGLDQATFLKENIEKSQLVDISKWGFLPIEEALSIMRQARLVLTNRYHGFLLSLRHGIPTIAISRKVLNTDEYYGNKHRSALNALFGDNFNNFDLFVHDDYWQTLYELTHSLTSVIERQHTSLAHCDHRHLQQLREVRSQLIRPQYAPGSRK